VKRLSAALQPFAGGAMYLNYLTLGAGDAGIRAAYGSNYERLAVLKSKYDPTNFFRSNRNIEPRAWLVSRRPRAAFAPSSPGSE
jgi:hypothetical protein